MRSSTSGSVRNPRTALALTAGLAALGVALGGCEGDSEGPTAPPPTATRPAPVAPAGARLVLHGVLRDDAGAPVAGARVRETVSGRDTRSDARGRFRLSVKAGKRTVTAARDAHVPHTVDVSGAGRRELDLTLWRTAPEPYEGPNSADRLVFWVNCPALARLSAAALERWRKRGVDGFVCMLGRLESVPSERELLRRLERSAAIRQAGRGRFKVYLGFFASNPPNRTTPLADWFDDRGWSQRVLPKVAAIGSVARRLKLDGVAIDQELYDSPQATWSWSYPGNRRSEGAVRAKARQRGAQLMRTLRREHPGLDIAAYFTQLPGSWEEHVQEVVNDRDDPFERSVHVDFWDGVTSVGGYGAVYLYESIFYKEAHLPVSWDEALRYNAASVYSLLSREFSNWTHAASRVHVTPFSWIDAGPSTFERARPPAQVTEQLAAFRRRGAGREFANYAYVDIDKFDYAPYADAMRAASEPGRVDDSPPTLSAIRPSDVTTAPLPADPLHAGDEVVDVAGIATDDFAVRSVLWRDAEGRGGTARVGFDPLRPAAPSWTLHGLRVPPGGTTLWLRVEDVSGLSAIIEKPVLR
jgi:hypothetical protein